MVYSTNPISIKARERYHNDEEYKKRILKRNSEWMKNARKSGWRKTWDETHPEEHAKIQARHKQKLKLRVLVHYAGNPPKCANCGIYDIDVLTIDHINNDGAKHREKIGGGGHVLHRWLVNNGFPRGFKVLCFNCNWKKRMESVKKNVSL